MKRFLVPLVLLTLAACAQVPTPGDGVRPDLTPLVFGGPGDEGVSHLAKHHSGVYTVGFTTNKSQPNPEGETDVFIRKYSSSRSVIWTRKFGTASYEFVDGAASDGSDNVYVVGRADGKLRGSVGSGVLFIRKYTASGSVTWTRQFGFSDPVDGFDFVSDVAVDGGGNAYVVGSTDHTFVGANNYTDLYVRKYSSSGSVLWTRQLNFSADGAAEAVAVSGSNVYVGVRYVPDAGNPVTDEYGVRIIKFSTSGVRAQGWGYVHNSVGPDSVEDLDTDRDGNVYFSGST